MATLLAQSDPLVDTPNAADILGIKPQTLETWRCTKRYPIPYTKVGRSVRYRLSDLHAFLASRTVAA